MFSLKGEIPLNTLLNFLTDLATNPQKELAFAKNPNTLMDLAGLSQEYQAILKSKEKTAISAVFTNEFTVLACGCIDPSEDPLPDPDPAEPPASVNN